MPRSNVTGGKHHKKGKKKKYPQSNDTENGKVECAGINQVYAIVKKKIGGSRLTIECSDGQERSGIIPGKFFKKVWMNVGDILLCDLNIGADDKICYIVHKYTPKDAHTLKLQGKIAFDVMEDKDDLIGYKFDDPESKIGAQARIPTLDDISDSDDIFDNVDVVNNDSTNESNKNSESDESDESIDLDNL